MGAVGCYAVRNFSGATLLYRMATQVTRQTCFESTFNEIRRKMPTSSKLSMLFGEEPQQKPGAIFLPPKSDDIQEQSFRALICACCLERHVCVVSGCMCTTPGTETCVGEKLNNEKIAKLAMKLNPLLIDFQRFVSLEALTLTKKIVESGPAALRTESWGICPRWM